jgi:hypothetical protein
MAVRRAANAVCIRTREEIVKIKQQTEPLGGQPAPGSKPSVADLDYQVKYQRAFEAVMWAVPAVAIHGFRHGGEALGLKDNEIIAYSKPATPSLEALTGNNNTPYIVAFTDLRTGPVVLELPAATDKASLYGQIVDAWQVTVADVGPSGEDKGKGGKLLLLPAGRPLTSVTVAGVARRSATLAGAGHASQDGLG